MIGNNLTYSFLRKRYRIDLVFPFHDVFYFYFLTFKRHG